jgi:hypothetical protein
MPRANNHAENNSMPALDCHAGLDLNAQIKALMEF